MKNFINFWDEFIQVWYEYVKSGGVMKLNTLNPPEALLNAYISRGVLADVTSTFPRNPALKDGELDPNELPEPYLWSETHEKEEDYFKDVKFVIINMNPGGASNGIEPTNPYFSKLYKKRYIYPGDTKKVLPLPKADGALVKEWVKTRSYFEYLKDWSCIAGSLAVNPKHSTTPPPDDHICGYDWWNGRSPSFNGGRMKWISSFASRCGFNGLSNKNVLNLELCPFHSKKWDGKSCLNEQYIIPYILEPAYKAAIIAKGAYPDLEYPFIFAASSEIEVVIKKIYNVNPIFTLRNGNFHGNWHGTHNWPTSKKTGNPTQRTYVLYEITRAIALNGYKKLSEKLSCEINGTVIEEDQSIRILITYYSGGNHLPSSSFSAIENDIINNHL